MSASSNATDGSDGSGRQETVDESKRAIPETDWGRPVVREDAVAAREDRAAAREDRAAAREDRAAARQDRVARNGSSDEGSRDGAKAKRQQRDLKGGDHADSQGDDDGEADDADEHDQDAEDKDSGGSKDDGKKNKKKSILRRPGVLMGLGLGLLLVIAVVLLWWWHANGYEDTDDAFVDARIVRVAPRISGQVTAVHVTDNQVVRAGDNMVDIDPADARSSLDQARAQQSQAETALGQAQADVTVAEAQRKQATATAAGAAAQALNASQDLQRYLALKKSTPQAVAQGQVDQAVAVARNSAAQRDAAEQQIRSAEAQIIASQAAVAGAQARIETVRAQVQSSQLNFGYTRVPAPVDGTIARRTVAVGTYVSPGTQLLSIVPLQVWITANFKEVQLARIRPGQNVSVHVDACPATDLRGHVDSIQRGAGQSFALLPAENATGNYVKVVQRVPVKILLDETPRDCPLGPGMSVEPKVQVR
jgi:membrane fusion protein (multidrug efflux system)